MKKVASSVLLAIWLSGLGYGHYWISNVIQTRNEARDGIVLPPFSQLNPRLINVFTLGHRGVYDDFVHIWLNHFLVDAKILKSHSEGLFAIGDTILNLRPMIETSYLLTCVAF